MDLRRLSESYLNYLTDIRGLSPQTLRTYKSALVQVLKMSEQFEEDGRAVLDIRPFRRAMAMQSRKSIAKKLSAVRMFVRYLEAQHDIVLTLMGDGRIKVPATLPKPVHGKKILEALEHCDALERLAILLIYGLGLRVGEAVSLDWHNVGKRWVRITGKGAKTREIPVPEILARELETWREGGGANGPVLENNGKRLSENSLRYLINKIFGRIGIKVTPHQLRHSFATDLLNHGARITDVSELLGHSQLSSTKIYTKLGDQTKLRQYTFAHPLCGEEHG